MRTGIYAAVIYDRRILIVRKRESWILPGGKPNSGETDEKCLRREIGEELSGTKLKNIIFYKSFQGVTPHKGDMLEAKVYFAGIDGELNPPSAEINRAKFAGYNEAQEYNLSDITSKVLDCLRADGDL